LDFSVGMNLEVWGSIPG